VCVESPRITAARGSCTQRTEVEHTIKDRPSISLKTGLGEFSSEVAPRLDGSSRATVRQPHDEGEERLQENDVLDRELMHRLHGDMRTALEEMRATQAVTLAALSNLETSLIRWIIFIGIALIIVQKLF
jgi:hypothetical protein